MQRLGYFIRRAASHKPHQSCSAQAELQQEQQQNGHAEDACQVLSNNQCLIHSLQVNYRWTCTAADSSACTLPAEAAAYKQLVLGPSNLIGFKLDMDYTFILTAGFTGSAVTSTASVVGITLVVDRRRTLAALAQ